MNRQAITIILSIYALLLGLALVFVPSEVMKGYGYASIDSLHRDLSLHIGLMDIILAVYLFINRKSENKELLDTLLWIAFWLMLTAQLYDAYAVFTNNTSLVVPASGYFSIGFGLVFSAVLGIYLKKNNS
jgi:uncharacterized membrane protein YczE